MINTIKKILNKELIIYIICGGVTTLSNIVIYSALISIDVEYKISNLIAISISIIIAYILNKNLVFMTKCQDLKELFKEIYLFIYARGFTFLIDYFGLIFMVDILNAPNMISKVFLTVLVIVLNYILGKKFVFKKNNTNQERGDDNAT